jgi:hypothetical protein
MNLLQPYGDGNHRRIKWRKAWDVDREGLTATHRPTGFALAFTPGPGGYTAHLACTLPAFGPDGRDFMAQIAGLRELMADAWEIFHTVMRPERP